MADTKLGQAFRATAPRPAESRFALALAGSRVLEDFVIPRLNLPVKVTLVSTARQQAIEADVHQAMRTLMLDPKVHTWLVEQEVEADRARRTLAEVVLEATADRSRPETMKPIGTPAEWEQLDRDILGECWRFYGDLRELHDPAGMPLTRDEQDAIEHAIKKKEPALLRLCGARKLSAYLLITADQRANSSIERSSPGGSSPSGVASPSAEPATGSGSSM